MIKIFRTWPPLAELTDADGTVTGTTSTALQVATAANLSASGCTKTELGRGVTGSDSSYCALTIISTRALQGPFNLERNLAASFQVVCYFRVTR